MRRAEGWRARRGDPFGWRSPRLVRAATLVTATAAVWSVATGLGALLLLVPVGEGEPLPGARLDAAMIAHAVPPLSRVAAERMVARLERVDHVSRWSPPGELEQRLVLAARIDPSTDRAVERLAHHALRTRAGGFALGRPTASACEVGLPALAEAIRGGALRALMSACRNAPGDGVGHAAFVVGDFMRAVGPEAESIVSRQPRAPAGEPLCFAGGYEVPPPELPICQVVHAELKPATRPGVLGEMGDTPPFVARWAATWASEDGAPLPADHRWVIDPAALIDRPGEALLDVPVAAYEDQRVRSAGSTDHVDRAWMILAVASERSAAGRHDLSAPLVDEALAALDGAPAAGEHDRVEARRLAVAIALRGGDAVQVETLAPALTPDDALQPLIAWSRGAEPGGAALALPPGGPRWREAVAEVEGGAAIAAALQRDGAAAIRGLWGLGRVPDTDRAPVREWLREAFPACDDCGFFARLAHHEARLDAAHALADDELIEAMEPIVARFEAVILNRGLALSLRAAEAR